MKEAVRHKPGKTESRLALMVMAMLLLIGAGVFMRQFQLNSAVVALRPEAHPHARPSEPARSALVDLAGTTILPFSPPERFTPDTLYEKINGRADLYLSSGFVSLETQRFTTNPASGSWMELFIYDMARPENAFSVFSMQRREGARPDDIAPNAYRTANALFLAVDRFYLEFIAADESTDLQAAMGLLAVTFIEAIGGTASAEVPGADLFPQMGLQPGSLQLITSNAFGFEALDRVYICQYDHAGTRATAFVSRRSDDAEAATLADRYKQTLLSYGGTAVDAAIAAEGMVAVQLFDTYEIIFTRGPYLAGIHEAGSLEAAGTLAQRLAVHLVDRESRR